MTTGIWVLGDQLWLGQSALAHYHAQRQTVPLLMVESLEFAQSCPYHRQKLVLVWSAMRHFVQTLTEAGWSVTYERGESFEVPLRQWLTQHNLSKLVVMMPNDRPFQRWLEDLALPCPLELLPNNQFFWSRQAFQNWASGRKRLILEDFYREGRQRWQILMADGQPEGGRWNFDQDNRKPPKKGLTPPPKLTFTPDQITQTVIEQVQALPGPRYGKVEDFHWGVSRKQGLQVLDYFLDQGLEKFGPYQDAMSTGQKVLWHSLLSPYLNLGLLTPQEVVAAITDAYAERALPLNSVEGFIRQVLGWREYMRGLYHWGSDDYFEGNWFDHQEALPDFYWDADQTDMACLHSVLSQVERTGYAHHIQRLMILSNFALIVGVNPQALEAWFHAAFIDAYDWVMQTNVLGMGQFADGGVLASKPYAASANYINKMSDYCRGCRYHSKERVGENACPFNFFYWDFLVRHQDKLKSLGRMGLILSHLKRMDATEIETLQIQAQQWRAEHCH